MNMRKTFIIKGIFGILVFLLAIGILIGWVKNIIKLTECDFEPSYKAEIIRIVGIFPPVGGIVGWMDVGK